MYIIQRFLTMSNQHQITFKVWGDRALFTRPEFKTEQVSYDVITPTAAKGVAEAIFGKPEIAYEIVRIGVLNPIQKTSILRNMIKSRQSDRSAKTGSVIEIEKDRTQRHALILRNVAYLITLEIRLQSHATDPLTKYTEIFKRRVAKGQCFQQPFLGCREFVAYFAEPEDSDRPLADLNTDLGLMLHSIEFAETGSKPKFFPAKIRQGVMEVTR